MMSVDWLFVYIVIVSVLVMSWQVGSITELTRCGLDYSTGRPYKVKLARKHVIGYTLGFVYVVCKYIPNMNLVKNAKDWLDTPVGGNNKK